MALNENLKNAKIAEEIFHFMILKDFVSIELKMEVKETETVFILSVPKEKEAFLEEFRSEMFCCRDTSIEEYAWGLSSHDVNEASFDVICHLIDSYDIEESSDGYKILMHRKKI